MNFMQAIKARMDAGSKPEGVASGSEAVVHFFKAPQGEKAPYIVLKTPAPGTFTDDTAQRAHDDPIQVSAIASSPADASALLVKFTDWAESEHGFDTVAPGMVVVFTPAAPRVYQVPSGLYQATCDLTARIERDRPR
ncbi:MAG: hypothetical protein KF805_12460 [Phycisphaeraceae bacterium]|nr:hypothetical protein [Phycisphaeraceae bacterium]